MLVFTLLAAGCASKSKCIVSEDHQYMLCQRVKQERPTYYDMTVKMPLHTKNSVR